MMMYYEKKLKIVVVQLDCVKQYIVHDKGRTCTGALKIIMKLKKDKMTKKPEDLAVLKPVRVRTSSSFLWWF